MNKVNQILELVHLGGPVGWVLFVLYWMMCVIVVERGLYFFLTRTMFGRIFVVIEDALREKAPLNILSHPFLSKYKNSQLIRILKVYLECKSLKDDVFDEKLDRQGLVLMQEMQKRTWLLSQIGHIAPLLGLLGTVLGLIASFQMMASLGAEADVTAFAAGIWEAMITTAAGLIVAIPAFCFYRFFEKVVEQRSNEMTQVVSILHEYFLYSTQAGVQKKPHLSQYSTDTTHQGEICETV
ncbi:MAG: MotA/TolQ/ExbB proton channel family protein [Spirochaetia bacterium]